MDGKGSRAAEIEAQFGPAADMYARSEHRGGRDLELLREWAQPRAEQVGLDLATGAGHTALYFAPFVRRVTVTDLSPRMLARARELFADAGGAAARAANADFALADVQALPFRDRTFDFVTCRIAPHHFLDIAGALAEAARMLRPGGRFLLVDSVSPEDAEADAFLDEVERLRDPTHVRSYRRSEWLALCARAGLYVECTEVVRKAHDFESWLGRGGVDPETAEQVRRCFRTAGPRLRDRFEIIVAGDTVQSFTDDKLVLAARRS